MVRLISLTEKFHFDQKTNALYYGRNEKSRILLDLECFHLQIRTFWINLTESKIDEEEILNKINENFNFPQVIQFKFILDQFYSSGFVVQYFYLKGAECFFSIHSQKRFFFNEAPVKIPNGDYQLSRFCYLRNENGEILLENPFNEIKLFLSIKFLNLILPKVDMNAKLSDFENKKILRSIVHFLYSQKFIISIDEKQNCSENNVSGLLTWEFHDLLFHSRSRTGFHNYPSGGTLRFNGQLAPEPVFKNAMSGSVVALPAPKDNSDFTKKFFFEVLENRHSDRVFGNEAILRKDLSNFLYFSCRSKSTFNHVIDYDTGGSTSSEFTKRNYPGAGACYELEIYLTISVCKGIKQGFYHYRPQDHALEKISKLKDEHYFLLEEAKRTSAQPQTSPNPQILIHLSARFARIAWKYQSIAYSLILKDVGVLLQTMALVSEALRLSGCMLGSGNSKKFSEIINTSPFQENSVGEFILGSKRLADTIQPSK